MPVKGETFKSSSPEAEIGQTGLRAFSGIIQEEIIPELAWPRSTKVYKEMRLNDPTIGAMLYAIEMTIRKVEWKVKDNGDSEKTKYVDTLFGDMEKTFEDCVSEFLEFLVYGFSAHEIVYKKRYGSRTNNLKFKSKYNDGLWGWRKLPIRSQDTITRWVFNGDDANTFTYQSYDTTRLKGLVQTPPQGFGEIFIPRNKFLLFRNNTKKDNPESTSVLRTAYRPWYFKKRIEEVEAIGIERNLNGVPVFEIPMEYCGDNATEDQKSFFYQAQEIVANLKFNRQTGLVIPQHYDERSNPMFKLSLLSQEGGSKVLDTTQVIERYNASIAQTVLADFILMGQKNVGSHNLSSNKTKMFSAAISAWLDNITTVFNKQAIPEIYRKNGWEADETMPTLAYGSINDLTIEELGEYFGKLVKDGAVQPDEPLENFLRSKADAPEKSEPMKSVEERIAEDRNKTVIENAKLQRSGNGKEDGGATSSTSSPKQPSN